MNDNRPAQFAGGRPKRILLVDDHPMIRERLAEVIQGEKDLTVCGEAEDCRGGLEAVKTTLPDLAIVDLSLKQSYGMDLIKDLHASHPGVAILVVSVHDESLHAERAMRAGARGYISKQEATKRILGAIRTVLAGKVYLSEALKGRLVSRGAGQRPQVGRSLERLTDRELRVFQMIGQGHSTRRIAEVMALHVTTVETYRSRIKEKLQLKDANELRQWAIRWVQTGGLP